MPRATAEAAARTARHVLDRADELFATRGFGEVSVDDVAAATGVTRGAVYHHYGSKAGLFRAVAARRQTQVAEEVVAAAERAGSGPVDQLRAGSHAFLDAITAPPAFRVLLVDAPTVVGWDEWRHLDATASGAHLRDALRSVGVADELLDATTAQLSGAMNEAALHIARHPDPGGARIHAHTVLDQILSSFLA